MDQDQVITVEHYDVPNQGPYPRDIPKKNTIPFTPVQSTLTVCHQEKEKFRV
jgi:intron-binding protein aquarius